MSTERERDQAEKSRAQAEDTRWASELDRELDEQDRQSAEEHRRAREGDRAIAEELRQTAEFHREEARRSNYQDNQEFTRRVLGRLDEFEKHLAQMEVLLRTLMNDQREQKAAQQGARSKAMMDRAEKMSRNTQQISQRAKDMRKSRDEL
jgi:hypothetical protein